MREIKFRAWDEDIKQMSEPFDLYWLASDGGRLFLIQNKKVMQFTGLKDKNGNEIYEGDIISGNDFRGIVVFLSYGWFVHRFDANGEVEEDFPIGDYEIKIIGNIYENPELLNTEVNNG